MFVSVFFLTLPLFFHFLVANKVLYYQQFTGNFYQNYNNIYNIYCSGYNGYYLDLLGYNNWTSSPIAYSFTSNDNLHCAGNVFFGADIFKLKEIIKKSFYNLPNHYKVYITFDLLILNTWNNQSFILFLDTNEYDISLNYTDNYTCQTPVNNRVLSYYTNMTHNGSNLHIKFQSNVANPPIIQTFAIKNLKIYLDSYCPYATQVINNNGICDCPMFSQWNLTTLQCECVSKFYMDLTDDIQCLECDITCKTCTGFSSFSCTSCFPFDYLSSDGSCVSSPNMMKFPLEFSNRLKFGTVVLVSWQILSVSDSQWISSECGPYSMIGGFDNFGYNASLIKQFIDLLPHYKILITLDLYIIDTWDYGEVFQIIIDDERVYNYSGGTLPLLLCGQFCSDYYENIYEIIDHNLSNISIKLTSNLDSSPFDESWGINNFQLSVLLCHPSCLNCNNSNINDCISCYANAHLNSNNECICNDGSYININSSVCSSFPCSECLNCPNECAICSNSSFCSVCSAGYYFYMNSCLSECPIGVFSFNFTCLPECPINLYISNSQCVTSCPSNVTYTNKSCYIECPTGYYLKYYNYCEQCNDSCKECDERPNNCLFCNNESFFLLNGLCTPDCPYQYYKNNDTKTCQPCSENCESCYGTDENKCLSCISPYLLLDINSTCLNLCPNDYFPNDQIGRCSKCIANCEICQNVGVCLQCNPYSKLINNQCKIIHEIKGKLLSENNPLKFKLNLNETIWDSFFKNYQNVFKLISVTNLQKDNTFKILLNYEQNDPDNITIILSYSQTFKILEKNLSIWIFYEDVSYSNLEYYFINQNFSIPLDAFDILCKDDEYYSTVPQQCISKTKVLIQLVQTTDPCVFKIIFSKKFPNYKENIILYSLIVIPSVQLNNYSMTFSNDSDNEIEIITKLSTSQNFINGPILRYTFNISDYFLLENNIYMPTKTANLKLLEYYPISQSQKTMSESVNSQTSTTSSFSQGSGYGSAFLSSGSSIFANGLMLVEMIFLLKFIDINYPPLVMKMFENQNSPPKLIFHANFIDDPEDIKVLPPLYHYYKVSVYFLNNVGEALCQMFAIIFCASIFIWATPYDPDEEKKARIFMKILIFIRDALVWEVSLFYILMNLQKLIFYVFCSWMFPPINSFNAVTNLSIATIIGLLIIIWLIHLGIKIKVCQQLKLEEQNSLYKTDKELENCYIQAKANQVFNFPPPSPSEITSAKSTIKESCRTPPYIFRKTSLKKQISVTVDDKKQKNFDNLFIKEHSILNTSFDKIKTLKNPIKKSKLIEKLKRFFTNLIPYNFLYRPTNPIVYLKRYEILHLDFKFNSSIHKYYAFLYYIRQCTLSALVIILHEYPFFQMITINIFNISFILYMIFLRPFTSKYVFFVTIVEEFITESAFLCGMLLSVYDFTDDTDYIKRSKCGWVIIFANISLLYWVLVTGILRPIVFAVYHYYLSKKISS